MASFTLNAEIRLVTEPSVWLENSTRLSMRRLQQRNLVEFELDASPRRVDGRLTLIG
jgi:hypothetical protein